jgi:hypothetical protein
MSSRRANQQAKAARAQLLSEVAQRRHVGANATVDDLFGEWLKELERKVRSPWTIDEYAHRYRHDIQPALGSAPVMKVRTKGSGGRPDPAARQQMLTPLSGMNRHRLSGCALAAVTNASRSPSRRRHTGTSNVRDLVQTIEDVGETTRIDEMSCKPFIVKTEAQIGIAQLRNQPFNDCLGCSFRTERPRRQTQHDREWLTSRIFLMPGVEHRSYLNQSVGHKPRGNSTAQELASPGSAAWAVA